jgi:hypothetical protein
MGADKDGRPFSPGRSSAGVCNPGVARHERRHVGAIDWRVFLSSKPSCAEPDRERRRDSGGAACRVRPHLRRSSRLTLAPGAIALRARGSPRGPAGTPAMDFQDQPIASKCNRPEDSDVLNDTTRAACPLPGAQETSTAPLRGIISWSQSDPQPTFSCGCLGFFGSRFDRLCPFAIAGFLLTELHLTEYLSGKIARLFPDEPLS